MTSRWTNSPGRFHSYRTTSLSGAVEPGEPVQAQAPQHSIDRGAGHSQGPGDVVRPPAHGAAQGGNGLGDGWRGKPAVEVGPTGAVVKPRFSFLPVASYPLGYGNPRDPELPGHFRLGSTSGYLLNHVHACQKDQPCVTMGHEEPPVADGFSLYYGNSRGSSLCQPVYDLSGSYN